MNQCLFLECLFMEGSALNGDGVAEAFAKMTQTVIYKIESGEIPEEDLSTQKPTLERLDSQNKGK